ncbi:MAG: hypothetical protein FJ271_01575 [Planctomycetes bacterium]|nr:hypothetical protein [Planctomycetota bacterium]
MLQMELAKDDVIAVLEDFPAIEHLSFRLENATIKHFQELPELAELNLYGNPKLTAACCKDLKEMKKLRALDLPSMRDLNAALHELKDMKQLRALRGLFGLNEESLTHLAELTQLEHLDIRVSASKEALQRLKKALPRCRIKH